MILRFKRLRGFPCSINSRLCNKFTTFPEMFHSSGSVRIRKPSNSKLSAASNLADVLVDGTALAFFTSAE
jgi:hypothetical protein